MERELLISQKKQETFNELEDICNFYYDAVNDFHYLSKQFPIIFGMNTEKNFPLTLNQLLQYVHPDDRDRVKNTVQTALSERTGYQIEYRLLEEIKRSDMFMNKQKFFLIKKDILMD